MQPGFGANKGKKKKNKSARKKAAQDDEKMMDATEGAVEEIDATMQKDESAKDKQRTKMELKQALKIRVNTMKLKRKKVIQMPGRKQAPQANKAAKTKLAELIKEQAMAEAK